MTTIRKNAMSLTVPGLSSVNVTNKKKSISFFKRSHMKIPKFSLAAKKRGK